MVDYNTQRCTKSKFSCIFCNRINTQTLSDLIEVHVARLGNCFVEIDAAVSTLLPAMEKVVAKRETAGAMKTGRGRDHSFLQGSSSHHHLEGRSGRVLSLNGA